MMMLVIGALLIGVAATLDSLFPFRMEGIGEKWSLLRGGPFDYSRYHEARKEPGWAAWPVHVMWAAVVCGITFLIVGFTFALTCWREAPDRYDVTKLLGHTEETMEKHNASFDGKWRRPVQNQLHVPARSERQNSLWRMSL